MAAALELEPAIVLDCGSRTTRCGFAGDDTPREFASLVGRVRGAQTNLMTGLAPRVFLGDNALRTRLPRPLDLHRPVRFGRLQDCCAWDDVEKLWYHTLDDVLHCDLGAAILPHAVLLTEPSLNPKATREKSAQILFEAFKAPTLCLANQAALSLLASGRTTGVVVDVGHTVAHVTPIHEGRVLEHAILRVELGGGDVDAHLHQLLRDELEPHFRALDDLSVAAFLNATKEMHAHVALDFDAKRAAAVAKSYELPDCHPVTLTHEPFLCAEVLFQPGLIGRDLVGLHQATYDAIMQCDAALRTNLLSNVLLAGGSGYFEGLDARLTKELTTLAATTSSSSDEAAPAIRVVSPSHAHSAWSGGSLLASSAAFAEQCMTLAEYDECGAQIVHRMRGRHANNEHARSSARLG